MRQLGKALELVFICSVMARNGNKKTPLSLGVWFGLGWYDIF
jgi:hypothetical protein